MERLLELRRERGLTLEEIAERIGESKSALLAAEFLRCDTERRLW